jgi:hypothetical protein
MSGTGQIDERVITGMEAGLAAGLLELYLALGDDVDLAHVSVHEPDMTSGAIGAAGFRCREFPDADGAKLGHAYLVGQLLTVARSNVESAYGGSQGLTYALGTGGRRHVRCAHQHAHHQKPIAD